MSSLHATRPHKALFLDRDGVINVNHGYVYRQADIEFIDGIFDLCRRAIARNYRLIIVTNQSGIARGYYSHQQFAVLRDWLEHQFWRQGIPITHTYYCPHHPQMGLPCCCRKPRPGMLWRAARTYNVDLQRSILVGDSESDIECARNAGVGTAVHYVPYDRYPGPALRRLRQDERWCSRSLRAIAALL